MTLHEEKAKELFYEGCNCAQAVFAAFSDITGFDKEASLRMASGFGAGFGRLREVCGACSGMTLAANCLYGYTDIVTPEVKTENYTMISSLINSFRQEMGTYICTELLNLDGYSYSPVSQPRTEEFYSSRPCLKCVMTAAKILDEYIESRNEKVSVSEL